jgi:hypothetical protein
MSALHFRFDRHAFFRATQWPPRHRRHPLLRLLMGLMGLALLAVLVVASVFVGAAMLAIGLVARLVRPRSGAAAGARRGRVVEGQYTVVDAAAIEVAPVAGATADSAR